MRMFLRICIKYFHFHFLEILYQIILDLVLVGSFSIIYRKKIISSQNFLQTFSIGCLCLRKKSPEIPQVEHHLFGRFPFSQGKTLRAKFFENFKLIFRQCHVYHSKALEKLYRRLLIEYSRFPYLTRDNSRRSCNLWSILDQMWRKCELANEISRVR